jgi:hypothetical protein
VRCFSGRGAALHHRRRTEIYGSAAEWPPYFLLLVAHHRRNAMADTIKLVPRGFVEDEDTGEIREETPEEWNEREHQEGLDDEDEATLLGFALRSFGERNPKRYQAILREIGYRPV